jgi:protein tyrosine phosphatase (PTP) superfamily phosphohydrolase (DUF442 family)
MIGRLPLQGMPLPSAARPRALVWLVRSFLAALAALGVVSGGYALYCGIIIETGNFRAVDPGVLYRSAQLGDQDLQAYARRYGIKSVLNLRGSHPGEAWYDGEMDAVHQLALVHYDYPLSAKRFVTPRQIADLLDIVRRAPKPLLIHCRSGADRSGLVAALYRYAVDGADADNADAQLSLLYGHFPYLTSRSGAMDASFWAYVSDREHTPVR